MFGNAKTYFVTAKHSGRLQEALAAALPMVDTTAAIAAEGVWFGKQRMHDPNHPVQKGDTFKVYSSPTQGQVYRLDPALIVDEHDEFMIVHKPPRLTIGPDRSNAKWNLQHGINTYLAESGRRYETAPITRLDFMVQGLALFPKTKAAEKYFFRLTQNRAIGKSYIAILESQPDAPPCSRLKDRIGFGKKARLDAQGKLAHSLFLKGESFSYGDEYRVMLLTGRRHQIRFHAGRYLAPIVGDTYYGAKLKTPDEAIALGAYGLNFEMRGKRFRYRSEACRDAIKSVAASAEI